jgi:hypothetical protein
MTKHIYLILFIGTSLYSEAQSTVAVYYSPTVNWTGNDLNTKNRSAIDSFFTRKNNKYNFNKYWNPSDKNIANNPVKDILFQEVSNYHNDSFYYKPSIVNVIRISNTPESYLVKFAFIGDGEEGYKILKCMYNLVLTFDQIGNFHFGVALHYQTKEWKKFEKGNMLFVVSPNKEPNRREIRRSVKFSKNMARLFDTKPMNLTYYSCRNPIEVMKIKGYDYVPNMFFDTIGGMAEATVLYSGNNSEYYPHEIVHCYLAQRYSEGNWFVNEGLATFWGGTGGYTLDECLVPFKKFILENKDLDVETLLFSREDFQPHISTSYVLFGLISKMIFEKQGLDGIDDFVSQTKDDTQQKLIEYIKETLESESLHSTITNYLNSN